MRQARGLETSGSFSPYTQKWKFPQVVVAQIRYLRCLRIFNDEVSSVLQLISRNGCHKLNHGKIAFPLLPDSLLVLLDGLHI